MKKKLPIPYDDLIILTDISMFIVQSQCSSQFFFSHDWKIVFWLDRIFPLRWSWCQQTRPNNFTCWFAEINKRTATRADYIIDICS